MKIDTDKRYEDIVNSTYSQAPVVPALWREVEEAFFADTQTTDAEREEFWSSVAEIALSGLNAMALTRASTRLLRAIDSARHRHAERRANRIISTRTVHDDPL